MHDNVSLYKNLKYVYAFLLLTALAYIFGRTYTFFTHGEISRSISGIWLYLLFFGVFFHVLAAVIFTLIKRRPYRLAADIYNSGVLAFAAGMFMNGFFEILSADKSLIRYYEFAGIGLMAAGFILIAVCRQPNAQEAEAARQAENDSFGIFIEECVVERAGARIAVSEFYSLYKKWAKDNNCRPMKKDEFVSNLTRRKNTMGFTILRNMILGLALRDNLI